MLKTCWFYAFFNDSMFQNNPHAVAADPGELVFKAFLKDSMVQNTTDTSSADLTDRWRGGRGSRISDTERTVSTRASLGPKGPRPDLSPLGVRAAAQYGTTFAR